MEYNYYEEQNNYSSKEKYDKWRTSIGLQKVDDLEPSEYLINLAQQNVEGKLTLEEVEKLLYHHYEVESETDHLTNLCKNSHTSKVVR